MAFDDVSGPLPEGIGSVLDTDLYKFTMQCAILKYFPTTEVTYKFTNRTPRMKLNHEAYLWLQEHCNRLENISVKPEEVEFLRNSCPQLSQQYLHYLSSFHFKPREHVKLAFRAAGDGSDLGDIELSTKGLWIETIFYEVPLLALTSEAYFKFVDRDWTYDGQIERAKAKGLELFRHGCNVAEFGTRRRRDYKTHEMVLTGLKQAAEEAQERGWKGKLSATSNVHFAMKLDLLPTGTVAHEWFMGVAAITDSYETASLTAMKYWVGTFGHEKLGVVLTDTFGSKAFLEAFAQPVIPITTVESGASTTLPSSASDPGTSLNSSLSSTQPSLSARPQGADSMSHKTYAQAYAGTRQDSGDPLMHVETMRKFYDSHGMKDDQKVIVFSDSLTTEKCIEYREAAVKQGFIVSFGVGTFFTNDFRKKSNQAEKSKAMNIVIKLSSADGRPAIKISDDLGKNTGDAETVEEVKKVLGYEEKQWAEGDESKRFDK